MTSGPTASALEVEIDLVALRDVIERSRHSVSADDHAMLADLVEQIQALYRIVRTRGTTISRLRRLFHLSGSEKTEDVLDDQGAGDEEPGASPGSPASGDGTDTGDAGAKAKPKKKGVNKGRTPVSAYEKAKRHLVCHPKLRSGDQCPACQSANVHERKLLQTVRLFGQAPIAAVLWACESFRCGACGEIFNAPSPPEASGDKYDDSAAAMIGVLHYGAGMPFNRLAKLQANLQTPLPSSTQWDIVRSRAKSLVPAYAEMLRSAAQGELIHSDDTFARVLDVMGKRRLQLVEAGELADPGRTGIFTTGILSKGADDEKIALFFTGRLHAGENLAQLLSKRAEELEPPVLMSDALSRNVPVGHPVIEANCNAHGRRNVVDEIANFPSECRTILEAIREVFKINREAREQKMSEADRLRHHQKNSGPILGRLRRWMREQFRQRLVEENSGLGAAIRYYLKHWRKLTLFLRRAGVPLTNNIAERALKMVIRFRKNSYFYRSLTGAEVGDIYMSLIHTAELHGANAVDYITTLLRHADEVAMRPGDWMPWNYRSAVDRIATGPPAAAA